MAKNVYLKRYIEEGQRHCVVDEANYKKKRPGYLLFCDDCLTPIKDDDADALVRQNPELLGFKPMPKKKLEVAIETNTRPSYSPDHVSKKILEHDLNVDEATSLEMAAGKKGKAAKPNKSEGNAAKMSVEDVEVTGAVKDCLAEIAKMSDGEFNSMKLKEVRIFGETLGLKIPAVGIKTVDALAALNGRAAELMENVKSDNEDYGADE